MRKVYNIRGVKTLLEDEIDKKLEIAEKQIDEGKTISAEEVFKEIEEEYGF